MSLLSKSLRARITWVLVIGYLIMTGTFITTTLMLVEKSDVLFNAVKEKVKDPELLSELSLVHEAIGSTGTWGIIMVLGVVLLASAIGILVVENSVVKRARAIVSHLNHLADCNFTYELKESGEDELGQICKSTRELQNQVGSLLQDIRHIVSRMSNASDKLNAVGESALKGVDKHRQGSARLATAMQELSASAAEVANNAGTAAESAQEADSQADNGSTVVESTGHSIQVLVGSVQGAADLINRLEEHSNNIGTILDVIRGIAEQTNLLALNAAIEAARAGEQGRGFAVVADEVRTLAQRTQQSTEEIQKMIEKLQNGAKQAVQEMEQSKTEAESCVEQAAGAGDALQKITISVSKINDMNTQIAQAATEQSRTVEDINQTVLDIKTTTDESVSLTQDTASTSAQLQEMARELNGITKKFKMHTQEISKAASSRSEPPPKAVKTASGKDWGNENDSKVASTSDSSSGELPSNFVDELPPD